MANWLDNVIQAAIKHKEACHKFGEDLGKINFGTIGPKPLSGPPPPPMPKPIKIQSNSDVYTDYLTEKINIIINYTESLELKIEMLEKRITELELNSNTEIEDMKYNSRFRE